MNDYKTIYNAALTSKYCNPAEPTPTPTPDFRTMYLTIEAEFDNTTVYFMQDPIAVDDGLDPLTIEVSADDGTTWTEVTSIPASRTYSEENFGAILATLDAGEKIIIRGENDAYGYYSGSEGDELPNCQFFANKECYLYGNVMSLVGGDNFANLDTVADYAFVALFAGYYFTDRGMWGWGASKTEYELVLPATTLGEKCYSLMFANCTGLTVAPALPAMTLATGCYSEMFEGCHSLVGAPALPALTLAPYCYSNMFHECAIITAPALPATTLAEGCYEQMFADCQRLTIAPLLPATELVQDCYWEMFYNCQNLNYVAALFTTTPGDEYTLDWLGDVAASGVFKRSPDASWYVVGDNGVPSGWTLTGYDDKDRSPLPAPVTSDKSIIIDVDITYNNGSALLSPINPSDNFHAEEYYQAFISGTPMFLRGMYAGALRTLAVTEVAPASNYSGYSFVAVDPELNIVFLMLRWDNQGGGMF